MDVGMMLAFIVSLQCLRWFPRQEDFICFICADWLSPQLRLCVTCFQKNGFIWDFRVSTNTWGGIPSPLLHIFLSHLCCIFWWLLRFLILNSVMSSCSWCRFLSKKRALKILLWKKCVETKCVRCLSSIWMIGVWQTEVLCSWSR